ncbi:methyl-accepting chemotaxis protein [Oceanispirochaeta sp.]|uniref:methyl-accepting chemotaxis protein n=1 Tax=Oceanispirochaeta sp. TaxID=2035350 RepID=UPI0026031148|nr:methyl-accepting chemotaxis protein [Oceanispirochaeta sp.]MDA3955700.1 methyl-accepting chemotaxis protein [Oceanispirochaeta sp.]
MELNLNSRKLILKIILVNLSIPLIFIQISQSLLQLFNPLLSATFSQRLLLSFKPTIFGLFFIALALMAIVLYRKLKPLINYIKNETDYEKARSATLAVPWILIITHSSLWILSNLAFYMAYHWETPGGIPFFWSLSTSVISGILGALFTAISMNILLIPIRTYLNIISRKKGEVDHFIQNKNTFITAATVLAVVIFTTYTGRFYILSDMPNGLSFQGGTILVSILFLVISLLLIYLSKMEDRAQFSLLISKLKELNNAGGDLTASMHIINFDQSGDVVEEVNKLMSKLHSAFIEVSRAAGKMPVISERIDRSIDDAKLQIDQILSSSMEMNNYISDQKSMISDTDSKLSLMLNGFERISELMKDHGVIVSSTSATIEEIAANIKSVSETTNRAKEISDDLEQNVKSGSQAVNTSISSIEEIHETSGKMNDLVLVVSKVAAQTKLLAMNAAIEAAHAGHQGRGFAVVADEVRKLAGTSSENTGEISRNIQTMNNMVSQGVSTTRSAGSLLNQILEEVNLSSLLSREIASAMEEQKAGTSNLMSLVGKVVDTSEIIQDETMNQVEDNNEFKKNIQRFVEQTDRVQEITVSQHKSNSQISDALKELKILSVEGKTLGLALEEVIEGFRL